MRVVLVNYRSINDVGRRLDSDALQDAEVVVVDNASDPEAIRSMCEAHGATAVLLSENAGFASGVNAAWQACRERTPLPLLLLNPDAQITRHALDRLLEELAVPGTTGVGPLLEEAPGRLQVGAGGGALTIRSTVGYFLFGAHLVARWRGLFLTRRQSMTARGVDWLCMASLLLTPDALERFGPLPEHELVYGEDLAWGTSATLRGARFRLVPDVIVPHPHGSSGASVQWVGALERLMRRNMGPINGRIAVGALRTGLAVRRHLGRNVRA